MKLCSPEAQALPPSNFKTAPRPETLAGLRVGFLDNTKPPADKVMAHLDQRLRERFPGAKSFYVSKTAASVPATAEMMQSLKLNCDVVITGFGD